MVDDRFDELSALPRRTPLDAVADEAFDRIAALVRTVLDVPVGLVSLVDVAGQVFPGQAGLPQPWAETRCTPLTHSFCQHVVRSRRPLVVSDARLDPVLRTNLAIDDIGVVGYAGIPLVDIDGVVVGSLCAIDTEPREWTAREISVLTDLAAACSAELHLRSAAEAAILAEGRTRLLLGLSEDLTSTMTTAEISEAVGKLVIGQLGGSFGGISVLDAVGQTLTYADLGALPPSMRADFRCYPLSRRTPSAQVVRSGDALFFDDLEPLRAEFPDVGRALTAAQAKAAAYLPLSAGGQVVGAASLLWSEPRRFSEEDKAALAAFARYTAHAVERAVLLADRREVAETLQAAMLPELPAVADVELAARYYPARTADTVGGDWYDAFALPDGALVVSVGDVAGHDTVAAAAMGQLRSMLRGLAIAMPDAPDATLSALDRVLTAQPPRRHATGILATLTRRDDGASTFTWSNAGHLPPLLIAPGQAATFLASPPDRPLAAGRRLPSRSAHCEALPDGSSLLLFTDGLVERRDENPDECLATLRRSADRHRSLAMPEMLDAIVADLITGPHEDDVVMLGLRTRGTGPAASPSPDPSSRPGADGRT